MDPWSKGDYSRHIHEALMVVEKIPEVNPPSGRVPGQVRRVVPILELPRRWNRGRYREKGSVPRVSGTRSKYRTKWEPEVGQGSRAATWHDLGWGRTPRAPGCLVAPLALLRGSRSFWYTDFLSIFIEFLEHCKYGKNL